MKYIFIISTIVLTNLYHSQFDYLNKYIPYDSCSLTTHPEIEIKIWAHVIKKTNSDPENYTEDSIQYIQQHFDWINTIYKTLNRPTLKNTKNEKPYIKDSRIRFKLDTISFYCNKNDWDRLCYIPEKNKSKWIKILSINPDSGTILIKGVKNRYKPILDSIILTETLFNDGIFHVKEIQKKENNTLIYVKEKINISETNNGFISYYTKQDKNCSKENWMKYTNSDKNYLHIFYTGSSSQKIAFGCGPSPFYLNFSGATKNGKFANAQLLSHEIGHCIGLKHTDRPQFDDLPSSDKFGWINCNNTNTSNNIMGYNKCRRYLSPLQIAYVHYRYSNNEDLYPTIYQKYEKENISYVTDNDVWDKCIFMQNDIIIKKNKTLIIRDKLTMAKNRSIILEKKSKLIVDGGTIKGGINKDWNGIIKCKSEFNRTKMPSRVKNIAIVETRNNGKINY